MRIHAPDHVAARVPDQSEPAPTAIAVVMNGRPRTRVIVAVGESPSMSSRAIPGGT
jgi:hypothetical protein